MAWTSAHFAVGMVAGGAMTAAATLLFPRAWKLASPIMTLGGIWAIVPDLPRLWREDFPSLPFASVLGRRELEIWLHSYGDVFCLHRMLDAQPNEYALHGFLVIVLLYNLAMVPWLLTSRRRRNRLPRNETHVDRGHEPIYANTALSKRIITHDHRDEHPAPCLSDRAAAAPR